MGRERELLFDKLASGDRPSVLALGLYGAESLRKSGVAVFMVDALGRVQLMPPASVQVVTIPRLTDEELDGYQEDDAVGLMVKQGSSDEEVLEYIKRRKAR